MRGKVIIGFLLVTIAAIVYFTRLAGSDEEKIRQLIGRFSHAVELKEGDTNPLLRVARARGELDEILDEDAHVNIDELPGGARHGRREIAELAAQATMPFRAVEVDVHDFDIKLDANHVTAMVGARATLRGTTRDGETRRDERALDFLMRKNGDAWRVATLTVWPPSEAR